MTHRRRAKGYTTYRTAHVNKRRKLLAALLQRGPISTSEIIEEYKERLNYKVKEPTVRSDISFLRKQGCPVEYTTTAGKYRLQDPYWVPDFVWGETSLLSYDKETLLDALNKVQKEWDGRKDIIPRELEEIENLIKQLTKEH